MIRLLRALFAGRYVRPDNTGQLGYGHALQPDMAGTGDDGVEQSFTAEYHVLEAGNRLYVYVAGRRHGSEIAGIKDHALAGTEFIHPRRGLKHSSRQGSHQRLQRQRAG